VLAGERDQVAFVDRVVDVGVLDLVVSEFAVLGAAAIPVREPTPASASRVSVDLSARPLAQAPLLASLPKFPQSSSHIPNVSSSLMTSSTHLAVAKPNAGSVASAHHAKDATLRVVVRSLPGRLSAKIILTGPHHVYKRVTRSLTLRLPAGAYSVSAAPVKSSSGSYYATTPRSRVVLRAGKAMSSTVVYATLVPKSTVVVPAGATSSLTGDPSGPRALTITGSAARAVRVGDSLSSGVTSAAPYGYLVKVTKVAHKSGSSATLDVENTTLLAALPTGEIDAKQALEPTAEAASANDLRRVKLTLGRGLHGSSWAHAAGFTINTENLECESSAGVHLGRPTLTFSPSMAVHASWGFFKLDSASISITAAESLSFGATADAGAHCSTSSPGIGLFPHPITLGTFDIQVGPVPVTVTPKLQLYLSGQATIEAKATFSLEQGASVTVGASYEHGSFHPISSLTQHFTPALTAEGNASGEIALTPTVDTLIYDVAGPSFDVGAVAKLNANVKASPWWTLQGCLQAGLGFVISPLDLNWSDPHLIELCKTLLSATSPPPATAIAASSPPTNISPPTITDEQGNSTPKVGDTLHAAPGSWSGSPTEYTYHWEDCKPAGTCTSNFLASATSTYKVTEHDLGVTLRVIVTAVNGAGSSAPTASLETGVVAQGTSGSRTSGAIAIAAGVDDTCALLVGGSIDCWGANSVGELGDGTTEASNTPVAVGGITNATAITVGNDDACAVLAAGGIDCWGWNSDGELGDGTTEGSLTPVAVTGISDATQVSAGDAFACALLHGGSVDCWGSDELGQLGDGTTEDSETPVAVHGINDAIAITSGVDQACTLLSGGSIDCWGGNGSGDLGDGTSTGPETCDENGIALFCSRTPVSVSGITDATAITSNGIQTCALLAGGQVDCWGNNESGELGDGTSAGPEECGDDHEYGRDFCSSTPVAVAGINNAIAIAGGEEHVCAVLTDGSVDCWGNNEYGELGDGTHSGPETCEEHINPCSTVPTAVSGITDGTAITAGDYQTCALLTGGGADCWGWNSAGELGDGTTEESDTPVAVSGIE
jgi:alpha-tubulin suppressor-like RCC1 family protein